MLGEDICLVCREPLLGFQRTYCSEDCEEFDWDLKEYHDTEDVFIAAYENARTLTADNAQI